mgnify:CR=1 FL=1
MDTLRLYLHNNPGSSLLGTISGYTIHLADVLSPILSFIILVASTITAISLAYIQYKRARSYGKNTSKKSSRNTR